MENIISYSDISTKIVTNKKTILLLYKSGHRESECAYHNLEIALHETNSISTYIADVNTVLDIHPNYGVTNIPSLLIFKNGKYKDSVKGCQSNSFYKVILDNTFLSAKPAKKVTVYSTPTCSWCTSLKTWLQQNGIRYKDVDISQDEKAAQILIKRSGHKGVPQIVVDKEIVVGFQLSRLKELLEINKTS